MPFLFRLDEDRVGPTECPPRSTVQFDVPIRRAALLALFIVGASAPRSTAAAAEPVFVSPGAGSKPVSAPSSWKGTWSTTYGPLVLEQDGAHLTGSYVYGAKPT